MKKRVLGTLAIGAAAALVLSGCSGDNGDSNGGGDEQPKEVSIGYVNGWTDGESMAYLYKDQFERMGYEVTIETMADNGPLYAGVAGGDIDVFAAAVPEVMQSDFWDEFGDDMEDIHVWYDNMQNLLAVPTYSSITSIDELAENADLFNNEIVGIEPGAGLTQMVEESVMPTYGLDENFTLLTSSTASMLTVLNDAIENEEEIVVTLWRPFWAFSQYDVRALEDPEGGFADPEGVHTLARTGFSDDFPELVEFIQGVKLDDSTFGPLETLISSEDYEGNLEGAVEQWISEHPDAFSTLITE